MGTAQATASQEQAHKAAGNNRLKDLGARVKDIRYGLRVSKDRLTFDQVLVDSIERWYESDSDFARKAGISPSAVSRYAAGGQVPKPDTIRRMAPWLRDAKGRAYSAEWLLTIAYPDVMGDDGVPTEKLPAVHPLALEVTRLLAEDSPMPPETREILANLLDHLIAPYRRYLRRRAS